MAHLIPPAIRSYTAEKAKSAPMHYLNPLKNSFTLASFSAVYFFVAYFSLAVTFAQMSCYWKLKKFMDYLSRQFVIVYTFL